MCGIRIDYNVNMSTESVNKQDTGKVYTKNNTVTYIRLLNLYQLTLWRRIFFFFLILAQPVYKMWIIQEPNKLALWNKLHFEEKKTESIEHV